MDDNADLAPGATALTGPIFIIGPPTAAQGIMVESVLAAPGTWDAGDVIDGLARGESPDQVRAAVAQRHGALEVPPAARPPATRLVAVPAPAVPVSFLDAVFPDAYFLFVHRDPAHERITDVDQWRRTTETTLDDLQRVSAERWCIVDWADLVNEPDNEVQRVFDALHLGWHSHASEPWRNATRRPVDPSRVEGLTPSAETVTAPVLERVRSLITPAQSSLAASTAPGSLTAHDQGLGELLKQLSSSVMVSTYQSNRVIVLRHDNGALGVHLRAFERPMGIALTPQGITLGTRAEVVDFRNFAAVAGKLEPAGKHDACFMPRNSHVTGDIAIHDLGLGNAGMWVVATQFSCLATLDADHSFVPRWKPPFITALAPEDRCHLNGLALVDGEPRYVTALGTSDTAGGWRAAKATGGVLMEVPTGEILIDGLSMPHSPRWHDGRLYLLESGRGRLVVCDLEAGTTTTLAELPGFTRGLSFLGHIAFVGTSQVRETATFGGLPIAAIAKRECGVWAVDTRTGQVLGSVLFRDRIQELFDVSVLPGLRYPEIAEQTSDLVRRSWFLPPLQGV